jgi:hypothetical protein
MKILNFKFVVLAIIVYSLCLLVLAPSWLVTRALGNVWHWQQVDGSIWRGDISQLQYKQLHFSKVKWHWKWPLQWELEAQGANLNFSTAANISGSLTELKKGQGSFNYKGETGLELTFYRMSFDETGCKVAQGARWQLKGRLAEELERFGWYSQGVLQCKSGRYTSDTGTGELALTFKQGSVAVSLAGKDLPAAWLKPFYE